MLHNYLYRLLATCLLVLCQNMNVSGQNFSENFETRNSSGGCDRSIYVGRCWTFSSVDVSATDAINGCSARSSQLSNSTTTAVVGGNRVRFPYEVTLPALRVSAPSSVTFNARINGATSNPTLFVIADPLSTTANSFTLTAIPTSGTGLATTTRSFSADLPSSGSFRIRFGMIGNGGTSRIILDNFFVSNVVSQVTGPSCSTDPLPVSLSEFSASQSPSDCSVLLNWATSWELNNEKFVVERSADARSFEAIGSVAGKGTTNANQRYSYTDTQPFSTTYYRLKQVDFDQRFEYSKMIAVVSRCSAGAIVLQYSQQTARLDVLLNQLDATFPLSIEAFDAAGRRLHQLNVTDNQPIASIDTAPFGSRFIIIRIADGSGKVLRSQRLFLPQ